jgi:hypothetical protein
MLITTYECELMSIWSTLLKTEKNIISLSWKNNAFENKVWMRLIIRKLQKVWSLLNIITWPDILCMMCCKCCRNHRPHILYNIINSDWYVKNILKFSCLNLGVWFDTLVNPQMLETSKAFSEFSSYTVTGLSQFLLVSRFLLSLEYQGVINMLVYSVTSYLWERISSLSGL